MSGGPVRIATLAVAIADADIAKGLDIATSSRAGLMSAAQAAKLSGTQAVAALVDAPTIATNAALGDVFTVTLAADRTLGAPTNLVAGRNYAWIVTQNGGGGHTLAFDAIFSWAGVGAPGIASDPGAVTVIRAVYDGTTLWAFMEDCSSRLLANGYLGFGNANFPKVCDYAQTWFIISDATNGSRSYILSGFGRHLELLSNDGHVNIHAINAAPADGNVGPSQISFWIDEVGNLLKCKVKYAAGTVKNIAGIGLV